MILNNFLENSMQTMLHFYLLHNYNSRLGQKYSKHHTEELFQMCSKFQKFVVKFTN